MRPNKIRCFPVYIYAKIAAIITIPPPHCVLPQRGLHCMKKMLIHSLLLTALAVFALLLMGAGSEMTNGVNSGMNNSLSSRVTNSMTSTVTTSITTSITTSVTTSIGSIETTSIVSRVTGSHLKSCLTSSTTNSHFSCVARGAIGKQILLSPYAEEVARIIKFERQILIIVKEITHDRIGRLIGFDEDGYQIIAPGIVVSVPEDKADNILVGAPSQITASSLYGICCGDEQRTQGL